MDSEDRTARVFRLLNLIFESRTSPAALGKLVGLWERATEPRDREQVVHAIRLAQFVAGEGAWNQTPSQAERPAGLAYAPISIEV